MGRSGYAANNVKERGIRGELERLLEEKERPKHAMQGEPRESRLRKSVYTANGPPKKKKKTPRSLDRCLLENEDVKRIDRL